MSWETYRELYYGIDDVYAEKPGVIITYADGGQLCVEWGSVGHLIAELQWALTQRPAVQGAET